MNGCRIIDRDPGMWQSSTSYVLGSVIGCIGRQGCTTINIADMEFKLLLSVPTHSSKSCGLIAYVIEVLTLTLDAVVDHRLLFRVMDALIQVSARLGNIRRPGGT